VPPGHVGVSSSGLGLVEDYSPFVAYGKKRGRIGSGAAMPIQAGLTFEENKTIIVLNVNLPKR